MLRRSNSLTFLQTSAALVGATYLDQVVSQDPSQSFVTLMLIELGLPTELDPSGLCSVPAFTGAGQDQMPFKLSQTTERGDHQLAVGRGRIGPRITQRFKPCPALCGSR
jgi:hypothetical protein